MASRRSLAAKLIGRLQSHLKQTTMQCSTARLKGKTLTSCHKVFLGTEILNSTLHNPCELLSGSTKLKRVGRSECL